METSEKKRQIRHRVFMAVDKPILATMLTVCVIDSVKLFRELEEFERQSEQFDIHMAAVEQQREAAGQNAMLEKARAYKEAQGQQDKPDRYAVFRHRCQQTGEARRTVLFIMPYRKNTSARAVIFRKNAVLYIHTISSTGLIIPCCGSHRA